MEVQNTNEIATDGTVNICIYGPSGIGKTTLATTLNKGETLILNMEKGLLSIAGSGIDYVNIFSTADLSEAYKQLTENPVWMGKYKNIVLDSISDLSETILGEEKKKNADGRAAYGSMASMMLPIIKQFRNLNYNVIFITKLDTVKDEITGGVMFGPMFPGQQLPKQMPYIVDALLAARPTVMDADGNVGRYLQTQPDFQWQAKQRTTQKTRLNATEPMDLQWIIDKLQGLNPLRVWYFSPDHEEYVQFTQREAEQQIEHGYDVVRIGSDEMKAKHAAWFAEQKASKADEAVAEQPANEN